MLSCRFNCKWHKFIRLYVYGILSRSLSSFFMVYFRLNWILIRIIISAMDKFSWVAYIRKFIEWSINWIVYERESKYRGLLASTKLSSTNISKARHHQPDPHCLFHDMKDPVETLIPHLKYVQCAYRMCVCACICLCSCVCARNAYQNTPKQQRGREK